jgi:RNA-directed DNA polymerase
MDQAPPRGAVRTVRQLQTLVSKSWSARLFAVRRGTQDNRGRHTAGMEGVKALHPPQRVRLAHELTLDDTATPRSRLGLPKRGTPDKRPLGVPTLHARARQTVVRQALAPEWAAKRAGHFYGWRPGRACWDASAAVCQRSKCRPQHLLKGAMAQCFDRLEHPALLAPLPAPPGIRRHVRGGLRSGRLEADTRSPASAGTPQGESVSPWLALLA